MYLRRHMDSQGFVSLEFIAGFNRIKTLSTDLELIKLVCQQSSVIEYRTSEVGHDRLRRREGWAQWVLNMADREESARNEGPKELHHPPMPQPAGFDQSSPPQWSVMSPGMPYGNDGTHAQMNGHQGAPQDAAPTSVDQLPNGTVTEETNGTIIPSGQPIESSTKAVSGESDSFSDAQLQGLTVIVRKQDQSSLSALPLSAVRNCSNGFVNSKQPDGPKKATACQLRADDADSSDM